MAFAQQSFCGFDNLIQQLNADGANRQKEDNVNRILYEQAVHSFSGLKTSQTILEIPIVVHIVHEGGSENISDSIVLAAIDQLNLRFQNASPYYDSAGVDVQIQFCLASVDPYGKSYFRYYAQCISVHGCNVDIWVRWMPA